VAADARAGDPGGGPRGVERDGIHHRRARDRPARPARLQRPRRLLAVAPVADAARRPAPRVSELLSRLRRGARASRGDLADVPGARLAGNSTARALRASGSRRACSRDCRHVRDRGDAGADDRVERRRRAVRRCRPGTGRAPSRGGGGEVDRRSAPRRLSRRS
jgi:hypothetical protein